MIWDWIGIGMLCGMVGLIFYELVQEVRGSSEALHDHYHE
jgi:hypothetical protein